jgi:heterodisulfide reductase subunit C
MEYNPNRVIKMIQNGEKDKVLSSSTIWLCMSCETCITRCPNNVDIARMMDVLRQMAIEKGVAAKEANVLKFHEAFLSSIKFGGRVHEMLMTVHYKLKSGDLFGDVDIAPSLFLKGKLSLLPPRTKDLKSVKNIFEKT